MPPWMRWTSTSCWVGVDVNAVLERVDVNRLLDPVDPHDPTTGKHVSVGTFSTQADANVALRQAGAAKDRGGWVSPGRGEGDRCNYLTGWIESNQRIRSPRTRGMNSSACGGPT